MEFSFFHSDSEFQILYAIEIIYIITTVIVLHCFSTLLKIYLPEIYTLPFLSLLERLFFCFV